MYHHIVKLSFRSFMTALLAALFLAVPAHAQMTSVTYLKRPDVNTDQAQGNRPDGVLPAAATIPRRQTVRDMMFGEEPTPRENAGRGIAKASTPPRKKSNPDHLTSIPHWSDSYTYQGLTYKYTMVGTDPKRGSATTTIPTVIIPMRFTFEDGTVVDWTTNQINGQSAIPKIINSPIFQPYDYVLGGVRVGNTQLGDAFQRANFWSDVSRKAFDYHVLLGQPTVSPAIEVFVPRFRGLYHGDFETPFGEVDAPIIEEAISGALQQANLSPQTLAIFYTGPVLYEAHGTYEVPGGLQPFVAGGDAPHFVDSPVLTQAFILSKMVINWFNDPFYGNFTPGWQIEAEPHSQRCFSDLFDDKLLAGGSINLGRRGSVATVFFEVHVNTPLGLYAISDGYFLDYFTRNSPSRSVNAQYGFWAHLYADVLPDAFSFCCARTASPPCTGHVEVDKTPVEFPEASFTTANGINNQGWIVGTFRDASGQVHGFVHDGQTFMQIDFPGAVQTGANAVNAAGQVVGVYFDSGGFPHGFMYFRGSFTRVDFPGATDTYPRSINSRGEIVGMYDVTQIITRGFIVQNGKYRTIDTPFGPQTDVTGINDRGELVGLAWDDPSLGPFYSFSYGRMGFAQASRFLGDLGIDYPRTLNNLGQRGGRYFNDYGNFSLRTSGGYVTIYGYPYLVNGIGFLGASVFGMNDKGQIVGSTFDPYLGRTVGYVATLPK